ncbi:HSF-type DNA-binding-domain-containing protein [Pilobolus umbonatus]|nr:HSF-type DNA-binding-domain-containing protein [Pilobolus umbonatus]
MPEVTALEHMTIPQSDTFDTYNSRNSRSSLSSSDSYSPQSPASSRDSQWDHKDDERHRRSFKRGVSTFITKLFGMVSDGRNQNLISWNPSGFSFLVCNATRFSQEVLPEHFKHSNFSSFVRQLNMYGFHKINKSPRGQRGNNENEIWEFSHPKFQRGRPDLLEEIKRKAMDSELLRRETGDIHASFAMVQLSQTDLLQQFRVLQENFANLLQGFEELKKIQLQQQIMIRKLMQGNENQRRNSIGASTLNDFDTNSNQANLFLTNSSSISCDPMQTWNSGQSNQSKLNRDMMMSSLYSTNNQSNNAFNIPMSMNSNLPPSPVSSILMSSPTSNSCDERITGQRVPNNGVNLAYAV